MVAPPFRGRIFTPKKCFLFKRYPLDTRESYDFSRLAHKRKTYYCQSSRMDQPITSFKTLMSSFHSHSLGIKALHHWQKGAFTRSFLCTYTISPNARDLGTLLGVSASVRGSIQHPVFSDKLSPMRGIGAQ